MSKPAVAAIALMMPRCCAATIDEMTEVAAARRMGLPRQGFVMHCRYCKAGQMIYLDGVWETKQP